MSNLYKNINSDYEDTSNKEFNTISQSKSVERYPKNSGMKIPMKNNEALNKFLNSTVLNAKNIDVEQAATLMKYLCEKGIDIRILNRVRLEFLKIDKNEQGWLTVEQFKSIFKMSSKEESEEVEQKIINYFKV